jgi:tetratricopeptide (TPR) repeat protein
MSAKIFTVLTLIFIFTIPLYSQLKGISSYDNAYRYFTSGDFEKAIVSYNEYIKSYPSDSKAIDERGKCYENLKQYDNALKDYSNAISLSPMNSFFLNDRGYAYLKSGNLENSLSDFTQSIQFNLGSPDGYAGRVQVYLDMGSDELALADINKAMLLDPDNPMHLITRAFIYSNLDDTAKLNSDLDKILNYYPSSFFSSYKSQIVLLLLDNIYGNIQKLSVLIDQAPGDRDLYFRRGFNYYLLKKFDAAISDFEKCINLSTAGDRLILYSTMFIDNSKFYKE